MISQLGWYHYWGRCVRVWNLFMKACTVMFGVQWLPREGVLATFWEFLKCPKFEIFIVRGDLLMVGPRKF